ncbi:uncharacterized protein PG986_012831 [Apiospora aurea]|uniref:alpha-L-rhamnosidase n=1 Tax=Apiospora aurea TaxID=335848 RepID=A0ABR1Q150_9PEZI
MQPLIENVRIEHHPTGLGIPHPSPRISWGYRGEDSKKPPKNWLQVSYEIQVRHSRSNHPDVLSFTVDSRNNIFVPWPDDPLVSRERTHLRVRAKGGSFPDPLTGLKTALSKIQPAWTEWSDWILVEAALLDGRAIHYQCNEYSDTGEDQKIEKFRPIWLGRDVDLPAKPGRARLYITALGVYEAYVNRRRVGNECMAPGWTSYNKRLQYQVFDVKDLLIEGTNAIDIHVVEGWYAGRLLWGEKGRTCIYGKEIGALAQLEIYPAEDDLAPKLLVCSDKKWIWRKSTTISSSIYDGEHYEVCDQTWIDANLPWEPVKTIDPFPEAALIATPCPPVHIHRTVQPKNIFTSPSGKTLVDFGQNFVGRINIKNLKRDKGQTVIIRHAEVLEDGELGTRPLRSARATDTITFRSPRPLGSWSPLFTFHGFRYVELTGWSLDDTLEPVTPDSISAHVLCSAIEPLGSFECSNPDLERLHKNVEWSVLSNFLSVPTDCPQRDERLGWTGDIQVFAPTASFLFDCAGMLSNWLIDLTLDQETSNWVVPFVAPDVLTMTKTITPRPQAVWDDTVVLLPWTIYLYSGDKTALEFCWYCMRKYVEGQLGDWLDPAAPPDDPGAARTDGTLVADAYLVHVTRVMYRISKVLNEPDDVSKWYQEEAQRLVKAFRAKYMTSIGLVAGDTQTSLALALVFGLHHDSNHHGRATAVSRLIRLVRTAKFKVNTGFAGTPAVLPALTSVPGSAIRMPGVEFQQQDTALQTAYGLLLNKDCPSMLYPVTKGATTIWERWDSMLPDGSINPGTMTSFNHYALGSIATWLYSVMGGLSPYVTPTPAATGTGREPSDEELGLDENVVGWRKIRIQPQPGGDVDWCKTSYKGGCGPVECRWELERDVKDHETGTLRTKFKMDVIVPPNATAVVKLPDANAPDDAPGIEVGSGAHQFECWFRDPGRWPPQAVVTSLESSNN